MRFSPTHSEYCLWRELSGKKIGFAFRRQLVIVNCIVDFACTKLRLVIEVDGASHDDREHPDSVRDATLAELGWRVLHVNEEDVLYDLVTVVQRIREAAERCASVQGGHGGAPTSA